jgi:hypothetical protein
VSATNAPNRGLVGVGEQSSVDDSCTKRSELVPTSG